jgi:hypothetical protein
MKLLKLIVILLLLILVAPDTFAHCKGKHATNPPAGHCDGEPPPEEDPLYDVFIDGGFINANNPAYLLPGEGLNWIWNGRQVGSTYAQGRIFDLDMTYIRSEVGDGCFPSAVKFGGFFRKAKKSTANGMFWFWGTTSNGLDDVLYLLKIDGYFGGGPVNGFPGNDEIMYMTDWTLKVENQGAEVASRSCESSGQFDYPVPVIFIAK